MAILSFWPKQPPRRRLITFVPDGIITNPLDINNRRFGKPPNQVSTVRFPSPVILTWIPKSLFFQFLRVANIYFLGLSIIVCMPFSPTSWSATTLPFVVVLFWTALKDLYEDLRRRRDDATENMQESTRFDLTTSTFVNTRWDVIKCGDLIYLRQNEAIPADLFLLASDKNFAFVSTANLDGETSLKERRPMGIMLNNFASANLEVQSHIAVAQAAHEKGLHAEFDEPTPGFDEMRGTISFSKVDLDGSDCSCSPDNFLPRGAVLRSTTWVVGLAAYVGDDCKCRMNSARISPKMSNLQLYLNRCVKGLVSALFIFCLYAATMSVLFGDADSAGDLVVRFCKYLIILYQVVPISLYLCFELLKLALGAQINLDDEMKDPETGKKALARTADLVEELGQVDHIFTDKTGTITKNEMVFARCCVQDQDMGPFWGTLAAKGLNPEQQDVVDPPDTNNDVTGSGNGNTNSNGNGHQPVGVRNFSNIIRQREHRLHDDLNIFLMCLATCHSAQVETSSGRLVYNSSSPDEVAFLQAADHLGATLTGHAVTSNNSGALQSDLSLNIHGQTSTVSVLTQLPFTSERKRMSVICSVNGELICYSKGADNVMVPICRGITNGTKQQVDEYARLGLRILIVASKPIDPEFFSSWSVRYEEAKKARPEDRERLLDQRMAEIEHDLQYCGITAIEDCLQDGVPETIEILKSMDARIWVLTGDKVETAMEIARSCNLLTRDMKVLRATGAESSEEAYQSMVGLRPSRQGGAELSFALILDGQTLKYALERPEGKKLVYHLGVSSKVCVCCRLAPQQKRRLIEIVRESETERITLAIGDGANDVPMILGAHIGIGVRGKEGLQSVQASDVAISQFRFLVPLLLMHGRRAYRRVATFLCYYIYKHIILAVGDVCWAHQNKFAGHIAYPEWVSSAYAAIFTTLPILGIMALDRDLPNAFVRLHPELYKPGHNRIYFNEYVFSVWVLSAVVHGALAWFVPNLILARGLDPDEPGEADEWWIGSLTAFTLVVIFVSLRLLLIAKNRLSIVTWGLLLYTFVAYFITLLVLGHSSMGEMMQPQIEGIPLKMLESSKALLIIFLTPLALLIDVAMYLLIVRACPSELDMLRASWASVVHVNPLSPAVRNPEDSE